MAVRTAYMPEPGPESRPNSFFLTDKIINMLRSPQQESQSESDLRARLLGHVAEHENQHHGQPLAPGHQTHNIDPAIAGQPVMANNPAEGTPVQEHSEAEQRRAGNKRELSTTKRAAQNRAAQRAFRQRKETHIRKLEDQVRDYANLSEAYKRLQSENYALRDYIINLQSRLIETHGEFPPVPGNIDLNAPRTDPNQLPNLQATDSSSAGGYDQQAAAAQAAQAQEAVQKAAAAAAASGRVDYAAVKQAAQKASRATAESFVPEAVAAMEAARDMMNKKNAAAAAMEAAAAEQDEEQEVPISERTDPALTKSD